MDKSVLRNLINIPTPSGMESNGKSYLGEIASELGAREVFNDKIGNLIFEKGEGGPGIFISGHLDSVGFMVSNITKEGMLKIISNGGIDRKCLPGHTVTLILDDGSPIKGFIGKTAIHNEDKEEYEKVIEIKDLEVDVCCSSEKEVEELGIYIGTLGVYNREILELKDNIISPDLDDKIGVFIALECLRDYSGPKIYVGALAGEEQGLRGATVASRRIDPGISIDIDVTFDTTNLPKDRSEVIVGKGPVICYGGDKSRALCQKFIEIAKKNNIPYQVEATRPGGTNTDAIQLNTTDCETLHIAIPLKNMHTPVECASWSDIENCITLIRAFLDDYKGLTPQ